MGNQNNIKERLRSHQIGVPKRVPKERPNEKSNLVDEKSLLQGFSTSNLSQNWQCLATRSSYTSTKTLPLFSFFFLSLYSMVSWPSSSSFFFPFFFFAVSCTKACQASFQFSFFFFFFSFLLTLMGFGPFIGSSPLMGRNPTMLDDLFCYWHLSKKTGKSFTEMIIFDNIFYLCLVCVFFVALIIGSSTIYPAEYLDRPITWSIRC